MSDSRDRDRKREIKPVIKGKKRICEMCGEWYPEKDVTRTKNGYFCEECL